MVAKPKVVIGLVGTTLDIGRRADRWTRWRPTVSVCQHPEFAVARFDLLAQRRGSQLAGHLAEDIHEVSPATTVRHHEIELADAWDFAEVYTTLGDFADSYAWRPDREDYYAHITTGTHVAQICLFLLCETRAIPARLLQSSPTPRAERLADPEAPHVGRLNVIDLELAKYDRLAARFRARQHQGASLLKAGIETRNAAFNRLIDELERVATRS
ncbi:MAG TPA: RNA repair transcriptional activator RtcR family protein, partial [Kofleriaceae bacterium]